MKTYMYVGSEGCLDLNQADTQQGSLHGRPQLLHLTKGRQ